MDELSKIIKKMQECGQISIEKSHTSFKCKAKETHEKTLSRLLITGAKPYQGVKIKVLGVN